MLPAKYRLTSDYDFRRVKRLGKGVATPLFGLSYVAAKTQGVTRLGIIVTNSLDKRAVYRNRVRRMFRDAWHENLESFKMGYDVVIVAFKRSLTSNYDEIRTSLNSALSKTPLL
ncbi:MAG: ribonuclease P protein component [candidate division WWE3 bacterium]|nr:ribonuclease P protein component [candidate division WWE3 bacterium]